MPHRGSFKIKKMVKRMKMASLGEGVGNIIEFSLFTNDEKHGRGGVVSE